MIWLLGYSVVLEESEKKNLQRLILNKVLCLQIYKGDNITLKLVLGSVSLDSTLK